MAYRYPSPSSRDLKVRQMLPSVVPLQNLNIPPPGFRHVCVTEFQNQDVRHGHPTSFQPPPPPLPPVPLLPPPSLLSLPAFEQTMKWSHTNESRADTTTEETVHPSEEIRSDTVWVKNWLQKKKKCTIFPHKKDPVVTMKVYEARQLLQSCLMNLETLGVLQKELKMKYHDLSPTSWKEKWDNISEIKVNINKCMEKLQNPVTLNALKVTLVKRQKKRQRKKRQHEDHKEMVAESRARRLELHRYIDTWLKDMQEVVEKTKREESLKIEADQVLSEVTHKKAEARRQLNMLTALQKLRSIRAHTAINRGDRVDADSGIRFSRVSEHLQKLWEDQLKGYDVEEQGLRVMLEEAVEERTKSEVSRNKQILSEWETLLFGKRGSYDGFYMAAEHDIEALIKIRKSWDKFVAPPGAVLSSSIPIGWVLPSNPSSEKWESLLKKDNDKY